MTSKNPIGIFDSGIGGLSIAKRIRELLPNEDIVYIADSLHAPYGDKSSDYIYQRSKTIVEFLSQQKAKAIVIACNTATVSAIKQLRSEYSVPIIGVEPGVKPAAFKTKAGVIGVMATTQTLKSTSFNELAKIFSSNVKIEVQPCPGLVEQVENLSFDSKQTEDLVKQYVSPLIEKNVDHIVLGCTHYAFLAPLISKVAGESIEIINTDLAVARETARRLQAENLLAVDNEAGSDKFWSSGDLERADKQFSLIWEKPVKVLQMK